MHGATYSYAMEQGPSREANRYSFNQEIPGILWNPKIHYRTHKCQPPVPILSQFEPVHTHTSHLLNSHLNILLPSTPGSSKWFLPLRFHHQNLVHASPLPTCPMFPTHLILLYFITRRKVREEYKSLSEATYKLFITFHGVMFRHKGNSVPKAKVNPNDKMRM